jgi:transposase
MSKKERQTRTKAEIADALGVSASTLKNWLRSRKKALEDKGVSPCAKVLTPKAVDFICDELGLEFDD